MQDCEECGRPDLVWVAHNTLWVRLYKTQPHRFLCPSCFICLYERHVAPLDGAWLLTPLDYVTEMSSR